MKHVRFFNEKLAQTHLYVRWLKPFRPTNACGATAVQSCNTRYCEGEWGGLWSCRGRRTGEESWLHAASSNQPDAPPFWHLWLFFMIVRTVSRDDSSRVHSLSQIHTSNHKPNRRERCSHGAAVNSHPLLCDDSLEVQSLWPWQGSRIKIYQ